MSNVKTPIRTVLTLASMVAGNFGRTGKMNCVQKLEKDFPLVGVINKNKVNREHVNSIMQPIHFRFVDTVISHGLSIASNTLGASPLVREQVEDSGNPLLQLTAVRFNVGAFRFVFTICNDKLAATRYAVYKGVAKAAFMRGNLLNKFGELALNDYDASAPEMELENVRSGREMTVLFSMAISSLILQALNFGKDDTAPDDEEFEEPDDEEFEELEDEDEDEDDSFEDSRNRH